MTMKIEPSPSAPGVVVVIPHFERLSDTAACCRALAAQTRAPKLVIVVDNASRSHTAEALAGACPVARILRLEVNCGFAGAVNAGIRTALAMPDVGYVWTLNNDTVCAPDTLAKMAAAAEVDERIGVVGCPLLEGGEGTPRRTVPAGKKLKWACAIPIQAANGDIPDYLCGASLLIRRGLLEDIGLFDEGFFFFFEDADFSLRAQRRGWRLAVAQDVRVEHRGSATIRRLEELRASSYRAGHVRFLRKYSRHPVCAALPPFLFRLAADTLGFRWNAVRGTWRGWREGWRISQAADKPESETTPGPGNGSSSR